MMVMEMMQIDAQDSKIQAFFFLLSGGGDGVEVVM